MDVTALLYLIIIVSQGAIFLVSVWWAYVYPKRSAMFLCFTVLSFGMVLNFLPPFYTRLGGVDVYIACREEWWWMYRHAPIALASIATLFIIIGRMTEKNYGDNP